MDMHSQWLVKKVQMLYEDSTLCDVTLQTDGHSMKAHRLILAACSEYFNAMFSGDWMESTDEKVTLKGLTTEGLQAVVNFAYYGKITNLSMENVWDITSAVHQCMIPEALKICGKYVIETLDDTNYVEYIKLSQTFDLKQAYGKVVNFVIIKFLPESHSAEHDSDIDPAFFQLDPQFLKSVLDVWEYEKAGFGEFAVIDLVWQWAKTDLTEREQHVPALLSKILKKELDTSAVKELIAFAEKERDEVEKDVCIVTGMTGIVQADKTIGYSPTENQWCTLPDLICINYYYGIAELDNCLYVCGGEEDCDLNSSCKCYKYVPEKNRWFVIKPMMTSRIFFPLVPLAGKLFALGGQHEGDVSANVEVYNPANDTWTESVPLPSPRCEHAGAALGGKIYTSGGIEELGAVSIEQVVCYDPESGSWSEKASLIQGRLSHQMIAHNDHLYVTGGKNDSYELHTTFIDEPFFEVYDMSSDSWTELEVNFQNPLALSIHGICSVGEVMYIFFQDLQLACEIGGEPPPIEECWMIVAGTLRPNVQHSTCPIEVCEGNSHTWLSGEMNGSFWPLRVPSVMLRYRPFIPGNWRLSGF